MAKYSIEDTTLKGIADAIRGKDGTTAAIPVPNMAERIAAIVTAPALQSKTVSPSTSQQSVSPDTGYYGLSKVTVNAMPTATQATPSITVSSAGLITASATQAAGYVAAGTKSATKQLTTQAAKTVTPSASNQTAVASGVYTTGAVTVAGDANLVAENIASGVSIFGVEGSHEGGTSLDTCTLTLGSGGGYLTWLCYTTVDSSGKPVSVFLENPSNYTDYTCVCNSIVVGCPVGYTTCSKATILLEDIDESYGGVRVVQLTAAAGETATISTAAPR